MSETITDPAALQALYGPALPVARDKVTDHLTDPARAFIAASPFLILATNGPLGPEASPRGDPPGFCRVVGDRRLLLPDRRGNNRIDGLRNILADPRVGLMFLIPGIGETLRVQGMARILRDESLARSFAIAGTLPATILEIEVRQVFYHCARSITRAALWKAAAQVSRAVVPTVGDFLAAATAGRRSAAAENDGYAERQRDLY
ncbi:MSMEG_1061 family FMN-dependent PPOX-type flavoprotein [Tabrizicola caldifontis]|uniref:MSMEG_1061 family FMN-dependent PPOX-type flavoprotein n=1 Tax=Tabrizicola caldifontis TaxID=2528036 RepID=UPI0010803B0B|nr:MSMEG_1061 family FMN-dependent PPOX-type flavoprotein [Rhodobacter sp. YIM 73028]